MTVKELIEKLQLYDQHLQVACRNSEGERDTLDDIEVEDKFLFHGSEIFGKEIPYLFLNSW